MITSVKLRNWKSHESSEFSFAKGSNLLVGVMGSGKSSVMDAICFALFGTFPELKSRRVSLEDVVMQRPEKKSSAEVSVELQVAGTAYTITRTVSSKGSEAFLRKNGALVEGPQSQRVSESVQQLLKMDYELFTRTIYSEQNKIDYFLALGKGDRKKQMDELLGIDRFETARSTASAVANKLKAQKAEISNFISGADLPSLESEKTNLDCEIAELSKKQDAVAGEAEKQTASVSQARRELDEIEKLESDYNAFSQKISSTEAELKLICQEKERHSAHAGKDPHQEQARLDELKKHIAAGEKSAEETRKSQAELASSVKILEKELADLGEKAAKLKTIQHEHSELKHKHPAGAKHSLLQKEKETEELRNQLSKEKASQDELSKALSSLSSAAANCPVCDAPLDDHHRKHLQAEKNSRLAEARKKEEDLKARLAVAERERAAVQEDAKREEFLSEKIRELSSEVSSADSKRQLFETRKREEAAAKTEVDKATALQEEARKKVSEQDLVVRSVHERSRLEAKEKQLSEQLEEAKQKLHLLSSKFSKQQLEEKRRVFADEQKKLASLEAEAKSAAALLADRKSRQTQIVSKISSLSSKKKEMDALDAKTQKILSFQSAVAETQAELRNYLVEAVNESMTSMWSVLYPYGDYKSLRLNASQDDYSLELQSLDGGWMEIENASGGEKSCASLSLRIAFATVLASNLNWLILDEPTHNLDAEAVTLLASALREELPQLFEQVFIITHDEALKEGASGKIYRIQRDKDAGDKSVVEEVSSQE